MMFGSFFSAPFNPNASNGMGGFQAANNMNGFQASNGMGGFQSANPFQTQAGQTQNASPFGASSPVFPQGLTGGNPLQAAGGKNADPLAQMGMASMSGDTQMLFLTIQGMMAGLMGMIATLLAGILNGSISGKAPAGSGGTSGVSGGGGSLADNLPGASGSNGGGNSGGGGLDNSPLSGNVKTPKAGSYGGTKLSDEQVKNAATIASVGKEMGMSKKDIQTGIATAMQESTLHNLNGGDRDSVGLFQQRPSCGWGTVAQCTDPKYAARKFFESLKKQKNRDSRSVTDLAQSVQRSAFPDAYQKWAGMAGDLVNAMV